MAKNDEKKEKGTKEMANEALKQPEITGGEQVLPPVVPAADAIPGATLTEKNLYIAPDNLPDILPQEMSGELAQALGHEPLINTNLPALKRYSVQAVAVPNNRRMRGGYVFTDTPLPVSQYDFTTVQWRAILRDPHLKVISLDGQDDDAEA